MTEHYYEKFKRDGVAVLPWRMSPTEVAEVIAHLDECDAWPNHVATKYHRFPNDAAKMRDARAAGQWPAFSTVMDNVISAPHVLEYALRVFPIAEEYFRGEFPRLYSVNCFWTQPAPTQYPETHDWHRDGDDRKQLGMFMFGTDVTEMEAPHLYQRGTHRHPDGSLSSGMGDTHAELNATLPYFESSHFAPPPEVIEKVVGPAGTMFIEDPNGIHLGSRPSQRPRLFLWARWGVSNPPQSYAVWDKLRPAPRALLGHRYPSDPRMQEAIRLVVS